MPKRPYKRSPDSIQDENGFIHGPYGSFHPATGQGLPIDAPEEYMREVLIRLIEESIASGPAVPFDMKTWMDEKFGPEEPVED
jgi:hypothetical protein